MDTRLLEKIRKDAHNKYFAVEQQGYGDRYYCLMEKRDKIEICIAKSHSADYIKSLLNNYRTREETRLTAEYAKKRMYNKNDKANYCKVLSW